MQQSRDEISKILSSKNINKRISDPFLYAPSPEIELQIETTEM